MLNYCKKLTNGINFSFKGISFCTSLANEDKYSPYIPYDKNCINTFLQKRSEIIANAERGKIPEYCENCNMYTHNEQNSNKIKYINIYHWYQCNCACFYCSNSDFSKLHITEKRNQHGVIDIMPMLNKLEKLNLLDEKAQISMVGGEPTLLKEFPDILKFAVKNQCEISILSNGILYEKYISKAINEIPSSFLTISIDSGTKETFKKIKRIDKFNDVIKNIQRYVKETKSNSSKIISKYILLPGVNDNRDEIDKWIEVLSSIGITNFFPTIEFCKSIYDENKQNIPERVCELYEYMKQRIKEVNPDFQVSTYSFVEEFVKNRSYKIIGK